MGQSPKTKATETKDLDYWPEISDDKSDPDYEEELNKTIMAVNKRFESGLRGKKKHISIQRIQFPVETAFARTLTKVQEMSLDFKHYVDFTDLRKHGRSQAKKPHKTPNAYVSMEQIVKISL